ncbi:MGDG synthase family glycosyltransferase [Heliophilum fasciatum]|uniref:Processive 1,2-diacylglycerol beta-glucosyltransferase n=1 Tax=Heliophilum fasciatum TaxID=35700 RepID=A0A4R2RP92_9FIRM|nr:glycosyltransferase [Heliophilum fasciatum]MCW2277901.1 processive 1,2-diacylglycerol beta-glucosyltransferase [Heliophilum fasciatum]TCP64529.1 processive 1,2-diacylglycerol beta-glucosyltransferase [Heliophilum fasciatum]
MKPTDVLLLSVEAGAGHGEAAKAVAASLQRRGLTVQIDDMFAFGPPWVFATVIGSYLQMLRWLPSLYRWGYRRAKEPSSGAMSKKLMAAYLDQLLGTALRQRIHQLQPRAILCTHPFPMGLLSRYRREGWLQGRLAGIVTDFTVHPFWVYPECDCYYVAAPALLPEAERLGVRPDKVAVTGIPINDRFSEAQQRLRWEHEQALHLPTAEHRLLLMGGSLGLGPLEAAVSQLLKLSLPQLQIIAVAGKDQQLEKRLRAMKGESPSLFVYGYTREIPALMACADLIVTKPGGLSSSEAMAMGVPQLLLPPLPGHEEDNRDFLISHHTAIAVPIEELAEQITALLVEPTVMASMRKACLNLGRPDAAAIVAGDLAEMLDG